MLSNFTVIYNASVLYPNTLRDLLMELAVRDLYRAKWTDDIHEVRGSPVVLYAKRYPLGRWGLSDDEWLRNLSQDQPNIPLKKLYRVRDLMNEAASRYLHYQPDRASSCAGNRSSAEMSSKTYKQPCSFEEYLVKLQKQQLLNSVSIIKALI